MDVSQSEGSTLEEWVRSFASFRASNISQNSNYSADPKYTGRMKHLDKEQMFDIIEI